MLPLGQFQSGDTRRGVSRASVYRYPAAAFGPAPSYFGAPVNEDGAEKLYRIRLDEPAVNVGAAVIASSPGSLVHPWFLGSLDENDVQGYAGTPVNVNNLTIDYLLDIGAPRRSSRARRRTTWRWTPAATSSRAARSGALRAPRVGGRPAAAAAGLITYRVSAGRPTLALRVLDLGSGVDPYSLVIGYGQALMAAPRTTRQRIATLPAAGRSAAAAPRQANAVRVGGRLPGGEERRLGRR